MINKKCRTGNILATVFPKRINKTFTGNTFIRNTKLSKYCFDIIIPYFFASFGVAARITSMGSGVPMIPVEETRTCALSMPSASAAA